MPAPSAACATRTESESCLGFRMAAAQGNEDTARTVDRLSRPHMVRQKKNLHALPAVRPIIRSARSLGNEYERRIDELDELKEKFQFWKPA